MNRQETDKNLKKDLGLLPAMALVIGMVIGSGIFMKPGKVIAATGDSTLALVAWAFGGVITLAAGLTIAELGAQIPKTGGLYACLDEVYGKFWAYLFGWVQTLIYGPATTAALGLYFASLMLPFLGWPASYKLPVAIATVTFIGAANCLGSKYGGWIQSLSTAGKLIPIVLISVFGIWKGDSQVLNMAAGSDIAPIGMGAAVLATLWAYDGWIGVGFVAGEMKNPSKQLPQAIFLGLGIVTLAYLAVNVALLKVLPASDIVSLGNNAAAVASTELFGEFGGRLISVGILVSIFGALNGYILTSARVPYAMAVRKQLPGSRFLAQLHGASKTPVNATAQLVGFSIALMTLGDPDRLTDISMFIIQVFYVFAFVAVFILRRKTTASSRPYSVPWYPVIPLVAISGSVYIVGSTIIDKPVDSLYALAITAAGIPLYLLVNKRAEKEPQIATQPE